MGSRNSEEHEVTLNLSIIQAVQSARRDPPYYESTRNGKRKRVYESVKPLHHFHMEYQLTPPSPVVSSSSGVYQTDIVTYSIVAKVFTDHDERVVNVWKEKGLTYYGWKHSHQLKVTLESLLDLYEHTLTIRLWNTSDKLAPRARFDRPKAFRLPVPTKHGNAEESQDSDGLIGGGARPSHLPNVLHDAIPIKRSRRASRRPSQMIECLEEGHDIFDVSPRKTFNVSMVIEEGEEPDGEDHKDEPECKSGGDKLSMSAPESGLRSIRRELTASQVLSYENLSASTSRFKGLSRRRLRQLQMEAEETLRIEKEGLVVLSVNFADLFASHDSVWARLDKPVANVKDLDICLSLATPLMSEKQCKLLNPMEFIVGQALNLPCSGQNGYKPPFVKYQFYDKPAVTTPPGAFQPHPPFQPLPPPTPSLSWEHTKIILLGTIEKELLLEYLRGPPLAIEVHDHDREPSADEPCEGAVFGSIRSDPLIGTCAYEREVQKKARSKAANSFGVAHLDLCTLLDGLKVMEFTLPILNDHSKGLGSDIKPRDYVGEGSQLTVKITLRHPLDYFIPVANSAVPIRNLRPLTPFGRIVFILSSSKSSSPELIDHLLAVVRDINVTALNLGGMPDEMKTVALSTYKLTKYEMTSDSCDVITGFHIDDGERHYLVCEGLADLGIKHLWENTPHHTTQDPEIVKVFYNSEFTFSSRRYGNLDVDLAHIKLPQPLSSIIQQPLIYVHGNFPKLCFQCLMNINELLLCTGLSDIVRNNYLPSPMMITALSLYCLQQEDNAAATTTTVVPTVENIEVESEDKEHEKAGDDQTVFVRGRRMKRGRGRSWEPLELSNKRYEALLKEREKEIVKNFVEKNIVSTKLLSDELQTQKLAAKNKNTLHYRSYSEEGNKPVHLYSAQTFNSSVLGKEVLQKQLDPKSRYTYSQLYHSRTIEPPSTTTAAVTKDSLDLKEEKRFVYPVMKSSLESNVHPQQPHHSRIEELHEPFIDNILHTSKLKPTVTRKQFKWNERELDFELYRPSPLDFGVKQPVTIHLAGETRKQELKEHKDNEQREWKSRVVVDDTRFHILRHSIKTETSTKGRKAASQIDKLQGLLKDNPAKVSLRPSERLRVDNLPSLGTITMNEEGVEKTLVGFLPGPDMNRSLKQNKNTIALFKPVKLPANLHRKDFVLYSSYCQQEHSLKQEELLLPAGVVDFN